ncbi:U7 snRNA-associated Sm-like protein LSm10 [Battus philenor]|uniref:U7 snRNA-associated Sm-like protein LSm10 n=1 Tax=Battus philenor TaxID=42288 RepID=UPI0035D120BC
MSSPFVKREPFIGTSKEKFHFHNTLLCLVKSLQGQTITVDLRNDTYVCGVVLLVDGYMNISFSNAVYCDPQGNEFSFENLFIQSRNIRYIHIPENVSVLANIKKEVSKENKTKSSGKPTEKSRKAKKALQRHLETVASLGVHKQ